MKSITGLSHHWKWLQGNMRVRPVVLHALVLFLSIVPVGCGTGVLHTAHARDSHYSGKQGQIVVVKVPTDESVTSVQGKFLGRTIRFFRETRADEPKGFIGLVGLDLQDEPGTHELTVDVMAGEQSRTKKYHLQVVKEKFHVEHLKLPKDKVDLDDKAVARWKAEQQQVREALAVDSQGKLWQPGFLEPVSGRRSGIFGSVRIMNGQPRNPHNGEDISAPLGTDVVATNDGVVRLTVDHFFSGQGVFLDHGLGLYSMYFHLSEVLVKDGERVKAGQVVGKVGATGRATGPHLHWGVKLNGARINPYALLDLPFKGETRAAAPISVTEPSSTGMGAPAP